MALLHLATLKPTKLELLGQWLPTQPWLGPLDVSSLTAVGMYRFDDPAGQVGVETHLLHTAEAQLIQVPVTYRNAPLAGADTALIGITEHSVLGTRWVYDGCGDPVYADTVATAILAGGKQADLEVESDGQRTTREPTTRVRGSGPVGADVPQVNTVAYVNDGATTILRSSGLELIVRHRFDSELSIEGAHTLSGIWPGSDQPTILAVARRR